MIGGILAIIILDMKRFWLDRARMIAGLIQPLRSAAIKSLAQAARAPAKVG